MAQTSWRSPWCHRWGQSLWTCHLQTGSWTQMWSNDQQCKSTSLQASPSPGNGNLCQIQKKESINWAMLWMSQKENWRNVALNKMLLLFFINALTSALDTVALPGCRTSTTIWRLENRNLWRGHQWRACSFFPWKWWRVRSKGYQTLYVPAKQSVGHVLPRADGHWAVNHGASNFSARSISWEWFRTFTFSSMPFLRSSGPVLSSQNSRLVRHCWRTWGMCVRAFIGSAALRSHFPFPFLQGRVERSSSIDAYTEGVNIINREDNVT